MSDEQPKPRNLPSRTSNAMRRATAAAKPTIQANAKWARNTAIGTAKGVAIAAAAASAGEIVRQGLRGALRHR